MFPRRKTASTVFVAAMCSYLLAATVAPSGQQSVTKETGRVVAIGDIHGDQAEATGVLALGPGSPPGLLWAAPGEQVSTGEQSGTLPEGLPVSRIKRKLAQVAPAQSSLLRLDHYVEVYGRAPRIDVLQAFDVHSGPVPYGAPTHAELLSLILPPESRTPPLLLSPGIDIIGWTW